MISIILLGLMPNCCGLIFAQDFAFYARGPLEPSPGIFDLNGDNRTDLYDWALLQPILDEVDAMGMGMCCG